MYNEKALEENLLVPRKRGSKNNQNAEVKTTLKRNDHGTINNNNPSKQGIRSDFQDYNTNNKPSSKKFDIDEYKKQFFVFFCISTQKIRPLKTLKM